MEWTLCDRIFGRIQTREAISVQMSTFLIDVNQVSAALNQCTKRSLLLLDEFGKGTDKVDGLAILAGTLLNLEERQERCPLVICSTHCLEMITQRMITESRLLSCFTHCVKLLYDAICPPGW
eukprot:m.313069 g.313069  ORF g.313069 m.313069 type:complete len:122 (-) comp15968_c0_seq42:3625-3990(-)